MTDRVFGLFFAPGEVVEIRALGCRRNNKAWDGFAGAGGTVAGYFNDAAVFSRCASEVDQAEPSGVYFTLNPVVPDLIARGANRLRAIGRKDSVTSDADVVCLRWLYVDFDPERKAGISATKDELAAAFELAKETVRWLEGEMGWSRAVRAMSGNGYHLLFRLPDLPPDDAHKALLRDCLRALGAKFSTDQAKVDETTFNPARICKLYGTMARKGDHIEVRPHRRSLLTRNNPEVLADVPVTDLARVRELANLAPKDEAKKKASHAKDKGEIARNTAPVASKKSAKPANSLGKLDLDRYLSHYGVEVSKVDETSDGTAYRLVSCVFDPAHGPNEASIYQSDAAPYLTYQCFHNSCRGYRWRDARNQISGSDKIASFYDGYDPKWKPPGTAAGENPLRDHEVVPATSQDPEPGCDCGGLEPPNDIDMGFFFDVGDRGRMVFVPRYMANYFARFFGPIVHTNGVFWRYENGLWREFPKDCIYSAGIVALKEKAQPMWVENAIKTLAGLVNRRESEWPDASGYINCMNGMVEISRLVQDVENALVPHDPKYGARVQVPCSFDPDISKMDDWIRFWGEVFPGDEGMLKHDVVQDFYGYCLLPDCRYNKSMFFYGTGANGKSTAMGMLEEMVGRDNISTLTITDLSQRFKTQFMQNKLVNLATETNTRDPVSTEIFKAAVAGDPITAERKYGEPYVFRPFAKWILAMNDVPVVPDKSYGFERRILIMNFPRRFEDHEIDPELPDKLRVNIDGIFLWSLLGLQRLLKNNGFVVPEPVTKEKSRFLHALYPLLSYIDERLQVTDGMAVHCPKVFADYRDWCKESGHRAFARNKFYEQLQMNLPGVERKQAYGDKRLPHFVGLAMREGATL